MSSDLPLSDYNAIYRHLGSRGVLFVLFIPALRIPDEDAKRSAIDAAISDQSTLVAKLRVARSSSDIQVAPRPTAAKTRCQRNRSIDGVLVAVW